MIGYAICAIKEQPKHANLVQFKSVYIDDLCVDEKVRRQHIAQNLLDHVRNEASAMGCYDITLNVWEGNDNARKFYDRMGFTPKSTIMEYILK